MGMLKEFKEFAFKGNVIDMSVGVVVGTAFSSIVTSIVQDIFTPLIAAVTGSVDFCNLVVKLGEAEGAPQVNVGNFINTVINFFIVAICLFFFIKGINKLHKKPAEAPKKEPRKCPYCKTEIPDDATRCPHCTSELK